jgi:hypothetical protein
MYASVRPQSLPNTIMYSCKSVQHYYLTRRTSESGPSKHCTNSTTSTVIRIAPRVFGDAPAFQSSMQYMEVSSKDTILLSRCEN